MRTQEIGISLRGPNAEKSLPLLTRLFDLPRQEEPEILSASWTDSPAIEALLDQVPEDSMTIQWEDRTMVAVDGTPPMVKFSARVALPRLRDALLNEVEFELAAIMSPHRWEWWDLYNPPSFSDFHYSLGWACAFRGEGHDRLVSRRWLKYAGPWLLIRDEERDVSFVQFHSLEADAETALEQARPGHQRMGISDTGGFIQTSYVYEADFDGFYLKEERILEIVVHGRDIPQVEMLDACALRHYQAMGEDQPLANVRYVFMTEENARKHLRELWLRELECWAIVDGQKVRLDEDYDPGEPPVPEWAE